VSLIIFTYRKLLVEKDGKFSSHFVCNVPKLNLRKLLIIYYESLKLFLQNHFLQMFLHFFILKLFAS